MKTAGTTGKREFWGVDTEAALDSGLCILCFTSLWSVDAARRHTQATALVTVSHLSSDLGTGRSLVPDVLLSHLPLCLRTPAVGRLCPQPCSHQARDGCRPPRGLATESP